MLGELGSEEGAYCLRFTDGCSKWLYLATARAKWRRTTPKKAVDANVQLAMVRH